MDGMKTQRGALMIEILVTIAIVVIGLWGLMEVQARLQKSEMESYQRTQALLLLEDMASRIGTNRVNAADYVTTSPVGVGMNCASPAVTAALDVRDEAEWCDALQGAAETVTGGVGVGALVGGRGCVEEIVTDRQYMVTVVWQGLTPIAPPPAQVACGAGLYNLPPGSDCADPARPDYCRRYVSTMVRLADLTDL